MDKLKAASMIQQQRRRWRSQASDQNIARRAERAFLGLAVMNVGIAVVFSVLWQKLPPRIIGSTGFVVAAAIDYWQSRRFTQIRKLLADSNAKADPR